MSKFNPDAEVNQMVCSARTPEQYELCIAKIRQEMKWPHNKQFSHWYWTQLSICYYETFRYKKALRYDLKAVEIAPKCPMTLWSYAGTLHALGRLDEAIAVYKDRLLSRGKRGLSNGPCREGEKRAAEMLNDCRFRLALCYREKGDLTAAKRWLKLHLRLREPRLKSIYTKKEVLKVLKEVS
jgi:tetratricopeptide (TPR) repeat protein